MKNKIKKIQLRNKYEQSTLNKALSINYKYINVSFEFNNLFLIHLSAFIYILK